MTKKLEFTEMDGSAYWETEKLPVGRYRIIENRDGTFEAILWFKGFEDIRPPDNWYDCRGGYIFLGREIRHWDAAKAICEQHFNREDIMLKAFKKLVFEEIVMNDGGTSSIAQTPIGYYSITMDYYCHKWEIEDTVTGSLFERFGSLYDAKRACQEHFFETMIELLTDEGLNRLKY